MNSRVRDTIALMATAAASLAFAVAGATAAPGDLDRGFGHRGVVLTSNGSEGRALALQQNGRIVAVGNQVDGYALEIDRYFLDGDLDPTFGNGGRASLLNVGLDNGSIHPASAGIDSHGRILVAGTLEDASSPSDIVVARVLPGGDLDTAFGDQGVVLLNPGNDDGAVAQLEIRPDDSIMVGGYVSNFRQGSAFIVARIDDQGELDSSYGNGGTAIVPLGHRGSVAAMAVDARGRATLAEPNPGPDHAVRIIRLNSRGELDDSFSGDGRRDLDLGRGERALTLAIGKRGRIFVGGSVVDRRPPGDTLTNLVLARLKPSGSLDRRFGRRGIVTTDIARYDYASRLEPQADGKIVVAAVGERYNYNLSYGLRWVVLRYRKNGRLDRSFSGNGRAFPGISGFGPTLGRGPAMEMQPNGRILLLGWHQEEDIEDPDYSILVRMRNDGRPLFQ